ncbi:hypothetical protein ACFQ3P_04625 [Paraburkholderia sabiae]|uniref:Uncharacterized protein n=1 Tax=Paraburkholderia sabiae TaxID=273251 RepID=A0ABU9QN85_9BURK|nr:hypothetical protein [Paraburkholderia sabiae]WJZ79148.1 hypothetical protein QEN71_34830 [Paraburkholderia sabiae]CAD6514463.1 hypothetical protein LMG24235_00925 [Paraburkholderia sabiae]
MAYWKAVIAHLVRTLLAIYCMSFCAHIFAGECATPSHPIKAIGGDVGAGTAALAGAAIGALAGFGSAWIREWFESRRNLTRLAVELADRDFADKLKQAEGRGQHGALPPIGAFYHYYNNVLQAIATNRCTPEFVRHNAIAHGDVEEAFRFARRQFEDRLNAHLDEHERSSPEG